MGDNQQRRPELPANPLIRQYYTKEAHAWCNFRAPASSSAAQPPVPYFPACLLFPLCARIMELQSKNLQSPIHGGFVFELSACELGGVWSQLPTMPFSMSVSVSIDKPMGGGEFRGQGLACSKVWGSNSAPQSLAGRGPYLRVTYIGCRVAPCIIWAPHCACGFG